MSSCPPLDHPQPPFNIDSYEVNAYPPTTFIQPDAEETQCRYCEEELTSWNDFLRHMNQFSYMCANCLDYYAERPWLPIHDIICIDYGKGVQLF